MVLAFLAIAGGLSTMNPLLIMVLQPAVWLAANPRHRLNSRPPHWARGIGTVTALLGKHPGLEYG